MIYFPQNVKTRQVFSPELTFGHLGRKESTQTLTKLNTCYSALESVCISLDATINSHDIVQNHPGLHEALSRCSNLCERVNGKIAKFTYSLENYLKAPTALWREQKGFVVEQAEELRAYLKMLPWSEFDDIIGRINDDPESNNFELRVSSSVPRVMLEVLDTIGKYYAPQENRI